MDTIANIIKIDNNKYANCVIVQTYKSLYEIRKELTDVLREVNINGSVLLDTLFHSGNTEDRFIELSINDGVMEWATLKPVNIDKRDKIRKIIASELKKDINLLNESSLTSVQKNLISKGVGI